MNTICTRRNFLVGTVAACAGVFLDMKLIEPRWLKLVRTDVDLPVDGLSGTVKVLHLSDMHVSDRIPVSYIEKAVEMGLSQKPDLICLTGDFCSRYVPDKEHYREALKPLAEHAPCFACMGNHDGGDWVAPLGGYEDLTDMYEVLEGGGISVLFNQSSEISIAGNSFELVGLGDYWAGDANPRKAFAASGDKRLPRIVLSHNPDSKRLLEKYEWDLMLCGHTHGGQLSLPIIGTPFAPVIDHGYVQGLNPWEGRLIYTTAGVGNLNGARFNCRPEVSILNIRSRG